MIFNKKAFTLTELMVVIAVSAILMAAAVPTFIGARNRSNASACKANLEIINSAIKEWALDNPDLAVANREITLANINSYIDGGFTSLEEPTDSTNSYYNYMDNDPVAAGADYVVKINADGTRPDPSCNTGLADHTL